jgi:hypothetical protein
VSTKIYHYLPLIKQLLPSLEAPLLAVELNSLKIDKLGSRLTIIF